MPIGLEIPLFGASAAPLALAHGASRLELNAAGTYGAGGLTPSDGELAAVADLLLLLDAAVAVRVMIRPRGAPPPASPGGGGRLGDFVYADAEVRAMEASIARVAASGRLRAGRGDGFVFGVLEVLPDDDGDDDHRHPRRCRVDRERNARLVAAARPFRAVFHRAFDEVVGGGEAAWRRGLADLAACGFDGVLTSGGPGKAVRNLAVLGPIIAAAGELGIEVIVGGGVRKDNVGEIKRTLKLEARRGSSTFMHSACLSPDSAEQIDTEEVSSIVEQLR
ncbi:CutC [Xylariomycetidae sp. FL0641]|nr:CutC [Xylariomycetidae sp. FL0641]